MSKVVDEKTVELIDTIKISPEYLLYKEMLGKVKQVEGLKEKIDDFRKRNFELQNSPDFTIEKIDSFEREYESFRENPLVSNFLAAELAFCRMLQSISYQITEAIDFE